MSGKMKRRIPAVRHRNKLARDDTTIAAGIGDLDSPHGVAAAGVDNLAIEEQACVAEPCGQLRCSLRACVDNGGHIYASGCEIGRGTPAVVAGGKYDGLLA